jgi:arylsulfatase A-like enzyme
VNRGGLGRRSLGSGLVAGAFFGASFALGEIVAAQLSGGRFSLWWFPFLCLYYAPASALACWAFTLWPRRGPDPAFGPALLYHGALFLELTLVSIHGLASAEGPSITGGREAAIGLALLVALASWIRARRRRLEWFGAAGTAVWIGLGFLLGPFCLFAGAALERLREPLRLAGFAVLVGVLMEGAGAALRLLRSRSSLAVKLLIGTGTVFALAWNLGHPADGAQPGDERRDPQPAPIASTDPRPNVVLIVFDTLRASEMSCYGYSRRTTPRLDAFAEGGTLYLRTAAASNSSLPTHASLFTGLYPTRNGAHDGIDRHGLLRRSGLSHSVVTLAQVLASRGYATAAIVSNFMMVTHRFDLDRGFRYFDSRPSPSYFAFAYAPVLYLLHDRLALTWLRRPITARFRTPYRPAEKITDLAIRWLDHRPSGQPYFLFLNYLDPHRPYLPPERYRNRWLRGEPDSSLAPGGLPWRSYLEIAGRRRPIRPGESAHLTGLYDGELSYLDEEAGRFFDRLKADRQSRDTWIIVTADHGESLGEHNTLEHTCSLYQELIHVPLIIHYPDCCGLPREPAVDSRPVDQVDLMPTILDVLHVPFPGQPDGVSILSGKRSAVYSQKFPNPSLARRFPRVGLYAAGGSAVVEEHWKYILLDGARGALFDLAADPGELRDVAAKYPAEVDRLSQSLARWKESLKSKGEASSPARPPSPEVIRQLRALGYLN